MGGWVGEISQAQISQRLHLTSATMNIPQTQACAACRFARVTLEETTDLATKRVWMFPEEIPQTVLSENDSANWSLRMDSRGALPVGNKKKGSCTSENVSG